MVSLVLVLALALTPTPAPDPGALRPLLECRRELDGRTQLVLGAENPGAPVTLDGARNRLSPSTLDGLQHDPGSSATTLETGTNHAVAVLLVPAGSSVSWRLGDATVSYPSSTPVPLCQDGGALPGAGSALLAPLLTVLLGSVGSLLTLLSLRRLARRPGRKN